MNIFARAQKRRGRVTSPRRSPRITGVMVMRGADGTMWCSLPSKPKLDSEGKCMLNPNGKRIYDKILEWRSPDTANRFSARVIAELRALGVALGDSPPIRQDALGSLLDRA